MWLYKVSSKLMVLVFVFWVYTYYKTWIRKTITLTLLVQFAPLMKIDNIISLVFNR